MSKIQMSAPYLGDEELKNVTEAIKEGWISSNGHFIQDFEKGFASYIGAKQGIAVNNGTAALHLALAALGLKKGDTVIVPSITSIACANSIRYTGAKPVFVDANKDYWCMDPADAESRIDERTKAIMPVHLYGHPCDSDEINRIAKEHNLYVVEDCAEAHGTEYKGKRIGTASDIACFSFYGNKIITTGEGGMCLTGSDELAERMRMLRNQGTKPEYKNKYYYDVVGFNYRMTNIQAAIGVAQLKKIDYLIERKRWIAKTYNSLFAGHEKKVTTAPEMPWAKNTYWYYSILVPKSKRDAVTKALNDSEIEVRPFFYPIHMLPVYKSRGSFPVSKDIGFRGLNLPSGPTLTEDEIRRVADTILSAV